MKKKTDLTPVEFEIMQQIWDSGAVSVRQVQRALGARRPVAYTTVMTLMDKLHRKGALSRHRNGKAFIYSAAVERPEVLAEAVRNFCRVFFEGSRSGLRRYLVGRIAPAPAPVPRVSETEEDIEVELL